MPFNKTYIQCSSIHRCAVLNSKWMSAILVACWNMCIFKNLKTFLLILIILCCFLWKLKWSFVLQTVIFASYFYFPHTCNRSIFLMLMCGVVIIESMHLVWVSLEHISMQTSSFQQTPWSISCTRILLRSYRCYRTKMVMFLSMGYIMFLSVG